jgi:hypothetical protein
MQATKLSSIRCTVEIPEGLRGCAQLREGLWYQKEAAWLPRVAGIERGLLADLRASVDEFLRPRFVPSGETKGRDERGVRASYSVGS